MAKSLFDQYGGFATVSRIVSAFYDKVLDSENLAPYFKGIEMSRQVDHQTKFMASIMGGPASFSADHLERAHQNLNINTADFDELAMLLKETFEDFDIAESDIGDIMRDVNDRRSIIVSK